MKCQICKHENLYKFLSLGSHPNPDNFLSEKELDEPEPRYPLDLYFCENCKLVQLGYAADPNVLFTKSFVYTSSCSDELVQNFRSLVKKIIERFHISSADFVVDVGSNDGTLLENYLPHKIKILGVDPSKAAELAFKKNVPTLLEFFNEQTAKKIVREHGKASIITATNVFAHVKELDSLMNGIKMLLKDDGIFIEESHYFLDLISKMEYDSIYAEHLRYYSLRPLIYLFECFGMDVFDAERIKTHGGSLRVYACKKGTREISENVLKILQEEKRERLYSKETFEVFAKKVVENRKKLRSLIFEIKQQGNHIIGIGAPAKGNTLLNYCEIGADVLDCLFEKHNLKVGRYSPGTHIKILEEPNNFEDQPAYALLLSWNLKDQIIPKLRKKGFKGKIIVPIPEPVLV